MFKKIEPTKINKLPIGTYFKYFDPFGENIFDAIITSKRYLYITKHIYPNQWKNKIFTGTLGEDSEAYLMVYANTKSKKNS